VSNPDRSANPASGGAPPLAFRLLSALTTIFNVLGVFGTFFLMILITVDVTMRGAFSRPIVGVTEIVSFSIVCIVFLQLGRTVESGRVTRAETIVGFLQPYPRVLGVLDFIAEITGVLLMAIIIYGVWPRMIGEYQSGHFIGTPGMFTFPQWPISAALVAGSALAAVHFLLRAILAFGAILNPKLLVAKSGGASDPL
jgi:C4-dicarboxylate transporter DctM subunit